MAIPNTKATFKEYCLRALGKPVVEINVDDDQVDDRIDEALQYFAQYHYDGVERMYLKHQISSADIARAKTNTTVAATDLVDGAITANWLEGKGFIPMPESVISVVNVWPFGNAITRNMFDVRYQLRLNDMWDFGSMDILDYEMTMKNLDHIDNLLVGEPPVRFNQHMNRLYIDMDWSNDVVENDYIVIECYRKIDPTTYTNIYDDLYLKRYSVALIKKQWGANLIKFQGVTMLGGVQLNGETLYTQGQEEQEKLEELIQQSFELAPEFMVG